MADSVFEAAKAEYLRLKKRQEEISDESEKIENRLDDLEGFFRIAKTLSSAVPNLADKPRLNLKNRAPKNTKAAILALAEKMTVGGKKATTREVLAQADQQGIKVGGKTERNRLLNVSAILSRSPHFKASTQGWSLVGEQEQLPLSPKGEGRSARTLRPSVAAHAA